MKILFTSDWQCSLGNLPQCEIILEQILKCIDEEQISAVVHLGDLKHILNPVNQLVTNFLVRATTAIQEKCTGRFIVLLGNHDRTTTSDDSHSCLPVLEAAGAMTFEEPGVFSLGGGIYLRMIPFIRDREVLIKALNHEPLLKDPKHVILAFHNEVRGCNLNVQVKSSAPISLSDLHPERYSICLGGHIHFPQKLGANVYYVGSPFAHDWGEVNQPKGFVVLDIPDFDAGAPLRVRRIPGWIPGRYDPALPGFPTKKSDWTGASVRIHVPVSGNVAGALEKARKKAETQYPGAVLHLVPTNSNEADPAEMQLREGSDKDLIRQYLDSHPPTNGTADQVIAYLLTRIPGQYNYGIGGITLLDVQAENVLSFEKVELTFETGLTLVTGQNLDWSGHSNGAGKSNLLNLLTVALFGQTLKGQTHDQWARRGTQDPSVITLRSLLRDQSELVIKRGRRPAKLNVFVDAKNVSMGQLTDTQKLIEKLTGLTWDVMVNSLHIGQHDIATVLTGTDKERKELFSRFLGLERFIKAQEIIRADIRTSTDQINQIGHDIDALALVHKEQVRTIEEQVKRIKVIDMSEGRQLEKEFAAVWAQLKECEEEIKKHEEFLKENQSNYESYLDRSLKAEARMEEIRKWLDSAGAVKEICPLCGSRTSPKSLEAHHRELDKELKEQDALFTRWSEKMEKNRRIRQKTFADKEDLDKQWTRLSTQRFRLKSELDNWKSKVEAQNLQIQSIEDSKKRRKETERSIQLLTDARKEELEHRIFLEFCLTVVSREGLPAYLAAASCPMLNAAAQRYSQLFAQGEIRVEFSVSQGDLDVQVVNEHGGPQIKDQSEGELRMAGLLSIFSCCETFVPCNVLVLDEPAEGLDATNVEIFSRGLSTIAHQFGCVYVTSHNPNLLDNLEPDRHLEVIKKNRISRVEEIAV